MCFVFVKATSLKLLHVCLAVSYTLQFIANRILSVTVSGRRATTGAAF